MQSGKIIITEDEVLVDTGVRARARSSLRIGFGVAVREGYETVD